jgi:hypothetical protein
MTFHKNSIRMVTSSGTTPKTNTVHTLEDDQSCLVTVCIAARDSAGTACRLFMLTRGFTKAGGVLSTAGATVTDYADGNAGGATWTATLTTSGNNRIICSFVGSAGLSVNWESYAYIIKVNKSGA